jgi:hypothetical protein
LFRAYTIKEYVDFIFGNVIVIFKKLIIRSFSTLAEEHFEKDKIDFKILI